jgi:hypothetical protein
MTIVAHLTQRFAVAVVVVMFVANLSNAANQTATVTPIQIGSQLPYRIEVRPYSMGTVEVPTLHSYAVGEYDGKWLFLSGRTNGLHGFNGALPNENFPSASQNREVWVVDIESRQTWHRPLDHATSGLSAAQIASLAPANTQFYQSGETLYVTGGYGIDDQNNFVTFDKLSAIDVPALGDWVVNGTGSAAAVIRQMSDPLVRVTGGAMYEVNGRTHLVFGQDYQGAYRPGLNGVYTQQVRSFDIVDDGVNLSIADVTTSTPDDDYRRRDLNIFPVLRPESGGPEPGLVVLSGVFTATNGAWTVPVEIDADGNPTMDDPTDANTFKQGFNGYHSAKLGLFSAASGEMHEVLFGGISLQFRDELTGTISTDNNLPFVNDITSVAIDADGNYSQHHLGYFPELKDLAGNRIRFGANSEFLPVEGLATFANGVIDLDAIASETKLGYIFGGLVANAPHTRVNVTTLSSASNQVFEVVLIPVPEPGTVILVGVAAAICFGLRRVRSA